MGAHKILDFIWLVEFYFLEKKNVPIGISIIRCNDKMLRDNYLIYKITFIRIDN